MLHLACPYVARIYFALANVKDNCLTHCVLHQATLSWTQLIALTARQSRANQESTSRTIAAAPLQQIQQFARNAAYPNVLLENTYKEHVQDLQLRILPCACHALYRHVFLGFTGPFVMDLRIAIHLVCPAVLGRACW
jgi:hypothetical protein